VSRGGKLIVDGLTAYFDENALCVMKTGFPFEKVFGGNIKEFKMVGDQFKTNLNNPEVVLPSHMWRGTIRSITAKTIGSYNKESVAVRNVYGKGEVIWVPSLLGLGARIKGAYGPLSVFLFNEIKMSLANIPVLFKQHQPGILMKTLQSGTNLITIIINKSPDKRTVPVTLKAGVANPVILFASKGGTVSTNTVNISPEETLVIRWNYE
jgi:beta-galactosidase